MWKRRKRREGETCHLKTHAALLAGMGKNIGKIGFLIHTQKGCLRGSNLAIFGEILD